MNDNPLVRRGVLDSHEYWMILDNHVGSRRAFSHDRQEQTITDEKLSITRSNAGPVVFKQPFKYSPEKRWYTGEMDRKGPKCFVSRLSVGATMRVLNNPECWEGETVRSNSYCDYEGAFRIRNERYTPEDKRRRVFNIVFRKIKGRLKQVQDCNPNKWYCPEKPKYDREIPCESIRIVANADNYLGCRYFTPEEEYFNKLDLRIAMRAIIPAFKKQAPLQGAIVELMIQGYTDEDICEKLSIDSDTLRFNKVKAKRSMKALKKRLKKVEII